jgi:ferredoxin-NADP reductase
MSLLRGSPEDLPRATLLYAVRSGKEALFFDEIQDAAQQSEGRFRVVTLASDQDETVDVGAPTAVLDRPLTDYDFYLCGPAGLLATVRTILRRHSVPSNRVHFERFELR